MKLLNVPKGHKKSETFFRVSEKLPREGFRSEASKPFRKSKAFSKSLQKSKTFEKGLEKDILSKTTSHTRKNCVAIFCVSEMQCISERLDGIVAFNGLTSQNKNDVLILFYSFLNFKIPVYQRLNLPRLFRPLQE